MAVPIDHLTVHVTTRSTTDDLARWQRELGDELRRAAIEVANVVLQRSVFPPDMETMRAELADGTSWEVSVPVAADCSLWHDDAGADAADRPTPQQAEIAQIVQRVLTQKNCHS
jgi:hypothetical protein